MDHWKKNQYCIVILHTCLPLSPKILMTDCRNCPQVTALRYIPNVSRHSFKYNLMGFSWLQVKVEKGRVKRCEWLFWSCGRKKEDTKGKWWLLQLVRAETRTYMIAFHINSVGLGPRVNQCYFRVSFRSKSFGISLSLSPNGSFTFSTCCYHLFFNSSACNFMPTSLLHFILY